MCPTFGCLGLSLDWTATDGLNWNFDGGVGLAVAFPGVNVRPIAEHRSGWSESTSLFGSAPLPGAQASYVFEDERNEGGWQWGGISSQYPRERGYGWGGGFVHMWHWGS